MSKSKLQIVMITLYTILMAICIGVSFWYYYVVTYGEEKTVINSFNVDSLTMADGSKQKIVKVNYFSNKNQNGLEMFEIQLNYFTDETRTSYYSNGLQFVANSPEDTLDWVYRVDLSSEREYAKTGGFWGGYKHYIELFGSYGVNAKTATVYNYGASQGSPFGNSECPITDDSLFRIDINGEIYALSFRGRDAGHEELYASTIDEGLIFKDLCLGFSDFVYQHYVSFDAYYYAHLLFEKVKSFSGGTSGDYTFEFLDLFDYKKWDGSVYTNVNDRTEYVSKVKTYITNNYSIEVNTSDDGAQVASDSIFNLVHGDSTYRASEDVFDDYFYGDETIKVNIYDFDLVKFLNNNVVLKLKDDFINYYSKFSKLITLSIEIDIDKIEELGYKYYGLAEDSGLYNFKIKEIYTIKSGQRAEVKL